MLRKSQFIQGLGLPDVAETLLEGPAFFFKILQRFSSFFLGIMAPAFYRELFMVFCSYGGFSRV